MKNIHMKDLLNVVTRHLLGGNNTYRISITDFECRNEEIQICLNKEDDTETYVILDLKAEDKFTELYDKLVTAYAGRTQLITGNSFCGEYLAYLIIEDKVMFSFKYKTAAGQKWLSKLWYEN